MSYETLFQRYGSPSAEADINIRGYLVKPDKLTQERIRGFDERAAGIIARCEETIAALQDYRRALAARSADLESAHYALRLELERKPRYNGSGVVVVVHPFIGADVSGPCNDLITSFVHVLFLLLAGASMPSMMRNIQLVTVAAPITTRKSVVFVMVGLLLLLLENLVKRFPFVKSLPKGAVFNPCNFCPFREQMRFTVPRYRFDGSLVSLLVL